MMNSENAVMTIYTTVYGREYDVSLLSDDERAFLKRMAELFRRQPSWEEFSRAWSARAQQTVWRERGIGAAVGQPTYRICQDLAARLGLAEGRLARPPVWDGSPPALDVLMSSE